MFDERSQLRGGKVQDRESTSLSGQIRLTYSFFFYMCNYKLCGPVIRQFKDNVMPVHSGVTNLSV